MEEPKCVVNGCRRKAQRFCDRRHRITMMCVRHHKAYCRSLRHSHLRKTHHSRCVHEPIKAQQAFDLLPQLALKRPRLLACEVLETTKVTSSLECLAHPECLQVLRPFVSALLRSADFGDSLWDLGRDQEFLLRDGCDACTPCIRKLQALFTESCRKFDVGKSPNQLSRDQLRGFIVNKRYQVSGALEDSEDSLVQSLECFMKANQAKHAGFLFEAIKLYKECALIQRKHQLTTELKNTLKCLSNALTEAHLYEEALCVCAEVSAMCSGSTSARKISDFYVLLQSSLFLNGTVPLSDLVEDLCATEGEVTHLQALAAFLTLFKRQIRNEVPDAQQLLTDVAFAVLQNGFVELGEGFAFLLQGLLKVYSCHGRYEFVDSSLGDFIAAQQLIAELEQADKGEFDPLGNFNLCNIAPKSGVRKLIIELAGPRLEETLVDIVMQTRKRDDITQASANAITLLNQRGYCFAHKDFSKVKFSGADLSGADLTRTNFQQSQLVNVQLHACKLLGTRLKQSVLGRANFEALALLSGCGTFGCQPCFSPDATLVASGTPDDAVGLWDTGSGQFVCKFEGHSKTVSAVCFSGDGKRLASGSIDRTITIWELNSGQQVSELKFGGTKKLVMCLSFTGEFVAIATAHNTITVWKSANSQLLHTLQGHDRRVNTLSFSPDSTRLLSGSSDSTIAFWDMATGTQLHSFAEHRRAVTIVCFSPQGTYIASGSCDAFVVVSKTETGQRIGTIHPRRQFDAKTLTALEFSPDQSLFACSSGNSISVWDVTSRTTTASQDFCHEKLLTLRFSPENTLLTLSRSSSQTILRVLNRLHTRQGARSLGIAVVSFSPGGELVAAGTSQRSSIVWTTDTHRASHQKSAEPLEVWTSATGLKVGAMQTNRVSASETAKVVCVSPCKTLIAHSEANGSMVVWDTIQRCRRCTIREYSSGLLVACFSPDSTKIASGGVYYSVLVWDTSSGKLIHKLGSNTQGATALCFSPDGQYILSGTQTGTLELWDLQTSQHVRSFCYHSKVVRGVCFSPDGSLIASGGDNKNLVLSLSNLATPMLAAGAS